MNSPWFESFRSLVRSKSLVVDLSKISLRHLNCPLSKRTTCSQSEMTYFFKYSLYKMFGGSSSCTPGSSDGTQLPTCPKSGSLELPFENYVECCQVNRLESCTAACPTISHDGQRFQYKLTEKEETDKEGALWWEKNFYNCACEAPSGLLEIEAEYKRWPQTVSEAISRLQKVENFKPSVLESTADSSAFFQKNEIMTEQKWTSLIVSYNKNTSSTSKLDVSSTLKVLDKNASNFDMSMVLMVIGGLIGIVFIMGLLKKMSSRSPPVRRVPGWKRRADSEISRLKRDPDAAKERLAQLEEEDD
jgi:hypothetical protein